MLNGIIKNKSSNKVGGDGKSLPPDAALLSLGQIAIGSSDADPCMFFKTSAGRVVKIEESDGHVKNYSNPHRVTKAQVGLSEVLNKAQLGATEKAVDSSNLNGRADYYNTSNANLDTVDWAAKNITASSDVVAFGSPPQARTRAMPMDSVPGTVSPTTLDVLVEKVNNLQMQNDYLMQELNLLKNKVL